MEKKKLELITARLKALNRISHILSSRGPGEVDFKTICRIFVDTIGYSSSWIALMNDKGESHEFSFFYEDGLIGAGHEPTEDSFIAFIHELLSAPGDYILNKDPVLDIIDISGNDTYHSISMKIIHNTIIYGTLSISLKGDYDFIREEVLIITEIVKMLSFFLYENESRIRLNNLFYTMFETTGTGVILIEEDTSISYANREFERLSGFSKKELEGGKYFTEFVLEEDVERLLNYHKLRRIDLNRAPRNYEFRFRDRFNVIKNIYMTVDVVPGTEVSIASFMNITEKKRLESEVLKLSELERQNLGTELHDGIGPHLVGVKFLLKLITERVARNELPDMKQLHEVDSLISQAVEQVRTITKGLKPVDIQSDGLIYALQEFTEKIEQLYGVHCSFRYDPAFRIRDNITATHLYYIVSEAVNNAIKHADPEKIEVSLKINDGDRIVEISDNGIGNPDLFDFDNGMGISIMKYRASIINADIDFDRSAGGGTRVVCTLMRAVD